MLKGFLQTGKASVIIDGQFGSTGKGLCAAWTTQGGNFPHIATTNAAANAGHTTKWRNGKEVVCYHLPTIGVMAHLHQPGQTRVYLNAGSIIDIGVLMHECQQTGFPFSAVVIHPRAAIIEAEDKVYEEGTDSAQTKLASTRKGVGRALARKVMREGKVAGQYPELAKNIGIIDLNDALAKGASVTVEVPQGMSLSINHGLSYPHCTSRDVSIGQALADANIHPAFLGPAMMCVRTMPIRVGNIFDTRIDDKDRQNNASDINRIYTHEIGNSGPCFPDQRELDWTEIGIEPELTTVTKRPRRIFSWSNTQYEQALRAARPDVVFLNFVNYVKDGTEFDDLMWRMRAAEALVGKPTQKVFGYGPCIEDITGDAALARTKTRETNGGRGFKPKLVENKQANDQ